MQSGDGERTTSIADNLARVRADIAAAARRAGRDPADIRLLPVSKTVSVARIREAIAAGERRFGENKVQEAREKAAELVDEDIEWSIIGHVQTNKVKYVTRIASEVQSLDRLKLARALDQRLQAEGRGLDVLIQVNTSGEASKFGIEPAAAPDFLRALAPFDSLRVRGLMTLAVLSDDEERVRGCFRELRLLRDRLQADAPAGVLLGELSMGMSGDYALAIEEGSSQIRVGQAIFGARPLPAGG